MKLEGKVAVITGGGSGLGRETSFLFGEEGAKVVSLEIRPERAEQAQAELDKRGIDGVVLTGDVGKEEDVKRAVDTAVEKYGRMDIMFANAGTQSLTFGNTAIEDVTAEEWEDIVSTNLTGVLWCVKHAARVMKKQAEGGAIVMTSSASAIRAFPTSTLYSATKGGVNGFCVVLSRELGPFGIKVNAINPLQGMSPNFMMPRDAPVVGMSYEEWAGPDWAGSKGAAPFFNGKPPTLRDNAKAVLYLASDDSGQMTGQSLVPNDGGICSNVAMWFGDNWVDELVDPAKAQTAGA